MILFPSSFKLKGLLLGMPRSPLRCSSCFAMKSRVELRGSQDLIIKQLVCSSRLVYFMPHLTIKVSTTSKFEFGSLS